MTVSIRLIDGRLLLAHPGGAIQLVSQNNGLPVRSSDVSWWSSRAAEDYISRNSLGVIPVEVKQRLSTILANRSPSPWVRLDVNANFTGETFFASSSELLRLGDIDHSIITPPQGRTPLMRLDDGATCSFIGTRPHHQWRQAIVLELSAPNPQLLLACIGAIVSEGGTQIVCTHSGFLEEECITSDYFSMKCLLQNLGIEVPLPEEYQWCGLSPKLMAPSIKLRGGFALPF